MVISNNVGYLVYGVPDGLEVCKKEARIKCHQLLLMVIHSSNELTMPEFLSLMSP